MTTATGARLSQRSPPIRGTEVGSIEGIENKKRGVTMDSAYL